MNSLKDISMYCKVCNSENNPLIGHRSYRCYDCGHIYIDYDGDGIFYHKTLYRSKGHEGTRGDNEFKNGKFTPTFHNRRKNICEKRIVRIKEYLDTCDSILDIGAGGGTFLSMVKDKVLVAEGTEVSDICAKNLTNDGYNVYHGDFIQIEITRSYDLVTCWHVLEHIKDIKSFPKKVYKVTNKHFVFEVPINRKIRNPDNDFDGHYHFFTKKSVDILFGDLFNITYIGDGVQMPCLLVKMDKK